MTLRDVVYVKKHTKTTNILGQREVEPEHPQKILGHAHIDIPPQHYLVRIRDHLPRFPTVIGGNTRPWWCTMT